MLKITRAFEATIIADYDAQSAVERELVLLLASLLWRLRRAISGPDKLCDASGVRPVWEFNYGLIPNGQVHIVAPLAFDLPACASNKFGYGDTEIGFKIALSKRINAFVEDCSSTETTTEAFQPYRRALARE